MTDEPDYSLNSDDVYKLAVQLLSKLPLDAREYKVQADDLFNVVVFAASLSISINQACQGLDGAPYGGIVLGTLASQLEDSDALESDLNELLTQLVPKGLGSRGGVSPLIWSKCHITAQSAPNMSRKCVEARP